METTPLTEVVSLLEQHNLDPNAGEGVSKLFLDRLIPLTVRDPSPEDLEVIVLLLKTFDLSNNFDTLYHVRGYPQGVSIRALIPSVVAKISLVTQCTVTLNDQEITVSVFTKLSAFRNLVITEVNRKTVQKPDTYIADYGIVPGQKIPLVAISRAD